ncbi:MAG: hypothetical protein ACF8OB_18325 [Phycisphaeraceae bacterium JB051]
MDIVEIALSILIFAAVIVLFAWPCCRISSKSGLHWALGLIVFLPFGLLILLYVWALRTWPKPTPSSESVRAVQV